MAERTADRRSTRRTVAGDSIVASAAVLRTARKGAVPKPSSWQAEGWGYYDTCGELRQACNWYANALSRCRLVLATRGKPGDEPTPLDPDDSRNDLLADLGSQEAQAQLLAAFAPHLTVPGIGYLVGVDSLDARGEVEGREFRVLSADELRASSGKFQTKDETGKWIDLGEDVLPVKVWRRHARNRFAPDSPVRALLPVLRELSLLGAHVDAVATSRLAGAGILLIAKEITFPAAPGAAADSDPFMDTLMDAMLTAIADRDAASAVVPVPVRIPGEYVDKVKHLTFSTPFDEHSMDLRTEARQRFAGGMDMPAEVLLGLGDVNHWSAWQIGEDAVKLHIVPMLATITDGLTVGWLDPTALAENRVDEFADVVVWYDTSNLTTRPDRSGDAKDLYHDQAIGLAALLRETGFDASDAPTPQELERALLIDLVKGAPTLFPQIAPLLGIRTDIPTLTVTTTGAPAADPALPAGESAPIPDTADVTPDEAATTASAVEYSPLVEACDGLVFRALERAGNRLRNLGKGGPVDLTTVPPEAAHTLSDPTCLADLDRLLEGAWDRVPGIADRYGIEPVALTAMLDRYCRAMLAAQVPHTFDALRTALDGEPAPA